MGTDKAEGTDCGSGWGQGRESNGGKVRTTVTE